MTTLVLPTAAPRAHQRRLMAYLDNGGKRAVAVWHRRGGKDLTALQQACKLAHERRGIYWHSLPTYRQAKKSVWDGFLSDGRRTLDVAFPPDLVKRRNESEMLLELKCGSIVQLVGSDTIDNLVGAGPIHVTFSEYSISKPKAWDLVRPMLRENGGSAAFIYTPRGNNHGKKLYDTSQKESGWFSEKLSIFETDTYANPESVIAEERAEGMPEALIRQEYLCDFSAALVGSVYGELLEALEKEGGVEDFEHERDACFSSWDLGIADSMALWVWRVEDDCIQIVDCYESHGKPIDFYLDLLQGETASSKPEDIAFAKRCKGYSFKKHFFPHDARARTLQTGISTLELVARRWGTEAIGITPQLSFDQGIQAGRWLLQQNTVFHARAAEGLEALRQYHYAWDEEEHTLSAKPEHDWSSHFADAWRYVACAVKRAEGIVALTPKPVPIGIQYAKPMGDGWQFDEILKANLANKRRRARHG